MKVILRAKFEMQKSRTGELESSIGQKQINYQNLEATETKRKFTKPNNRKTKIESNNSNSNQRKF